VGNAKDQLGGLDGLKNWSGKCEGSAKGARRVKEPEWEMRRTGARGTNNCLKRKVFLKNQKHQPNIFEITHLCIMHGVHTSNLYKKRVLTSVFFGRNFAQLADDKKNPVRPLQSFF